MFGPVMVTVQIHSRKKDFERVKMTTARSTSIHESSTTYASLLQDLRKRGVCRCAVEILLEAERAEGV
jgi:hypothetical protein